MIIYFDDNGILNKKIVIPKLICNYDFRNGKINTFLYKQTLLVAQIHRDTGALMLNIVLLSYDDFVIAKHHFYFENIKNINEIKTINNRFLCVNNHIFDMGSTRFEKRKIQPIITNIFSSKISEEDNLIINSYVVSNLELQNNIKEEEKYDDGYPNTCIECNKVTFIAKYNYYNNVYKCDCLIGLGNGYCHDCKIRYSNTNKNYECCRLLPNTNNICSNIVTKNNMCNKVHSSTFDTMILSYGKSSIRYPYKKEINMTRVTLKK